MPKPCHFQNHDRLESDRPASGPCSGEAVREGVRGGLKKAFSGTVESKAFSSTVDSKAFSSTVGPKAFSSTVDSKAFSSTQLVTLHPDPGCSERFQIESVDNLYTWFKEIYYT